MEACQNILDQLRGGDAEVQREAAFYAGESRCDAAVPLLTEMVGSQNVGVQEAAEQALRRIGGQATVQALVPLLRSDEANVRNIAMDVLRQVGEQNLDTLVAILRDEDPDIRIFAADILGSTGHENAVKALNEALLKDPEVNVRYQAAVSLGELAHPGGAKSLKQAMGDDEWVQFAVVEALAKIKDDTAVGVLAGALDKASDLVASMIVEALGSMGNIKAVALLMRKLDLSPSPLKSKIVVALVNILGGKSLALLSEAERAKFDECLVAALDDEDTEVQDAAMVGLSSVGGEAASRRILFLAAELDEERDRERILAAQDALAAIGPNAALAEAFAAEGQLARVAVDVAARLGDAGLNSDIMHAFWTADRDLQRTMVSSLAQAAGPEATDFFYQILEQHADGHVLKAALGYLGANAVGAEAGAKVFALLQHEYDDVKEVALEACMAMWDKDMAARFETMAGSGEPIERLMAVFALGKVVGNEHLGLLKAAVGDEVPDVRKVALESLARHCCDDIETMDYLSKGLADEHPEVRRGVIDGLNGLVGDSVVELLATALKDPDDWVRIRAMEALAERRVAEAVPLFVPMLGDENPMVALKAMDSLARTGGPDAGEALRSMLDHEDPQLQSHAAECLAALHDGSQGAGQSEVN
jgi:HEAT repeat protein